MRSYSLEEKLEIESKYESIKGKLCIKKNNEIYVPDSISFKEVIKTTFGFNPRVRYEISEILIYKYTDLTKVVDQYEMMNRLSMLIDMFVEDRNRFKKLKESLNNLGFSVEKN
jgi:hypothetical protein